MEKHSTSLRLTSEAKRLLTLLAQQSGITLSAALEIAIREQARRKGIR